LSNLEEKEERNEEEVGYTAGDDGADDGGGGGPASADHLERDRDEHFLGYYPVYGVVDDVNFVNVRERNWRDGRCFVEDIDRDGYIAEYDYTCYY